MRTLIEIIEEAKDGIMPTHEECYYAMLAYSSMLYFDHKALQDELLSEKETPKFIKEMKAQNSFDMLKGALNKSPKEWLGDSHDPMKPEYQKFRKAAGKLLDKVMNSRE